LNAIPAGGTISYPILNAKHVVENFNYYRRESIVARTLAYGEVAALFRGLKDARVDLRELASRVEETSGGLSPQRSRPTKLDGPWLEYLKEIQARDQYANWFGPPYDFFVCDKRDPEPSLSIRACTNVINLGERSDKRNLFSAYVRRGNAYRVERDYDRAIADYSKGIEIDPKNIAVAYTLGIASAYGMRAMAYFGKRDYDRAMADYTEAIRLNPKYAEAYNFRGVMWAVHKRDYDRAMADFTEAIRLNPKYAEAYNFRGLMWAKKGNKQRAIADYRQALVINPSLEIARKNLATLGARP
jgi:tetratricopeptide (TPR) repeat protein